MADKADIGAKIEIDGEKQYRDNLKAIDAELKAMRSEMDLADKLKLMNAQYERSAGRLNDLGTALDAAKKEFGDNSVEAGKAQDAYNKQLTAAMNLKTQINKTATELQKSKTDFANLGTAADKLGDSLDNVEDASGKLISPVHLSI